MNLLENTIFVYNQNDADSLSIANNYKDLYLLDSSQLIPVNCSNDEILSDYNDFLTQIGNTVFNKIDNGSRIIVIGYNVPGGYLDTDGNVISVTSRISGYLLGDETKLKNPLYDRQISQTLSDEDFSKIVICSRIDAPSVDIAKNMISRQNEYYNQLYANGRFFYDPYAYFDNSGIYDDFATKYREELIYFKNNLLVDMNVEVVSTVLLNELTDVVMPYLRRESFYWGWFTDRTTKSFFKDSDAARVFFYNADYDSSLTIRNFSYNNFSPLAINAGYVSTAGAMSNPGIDGFLRPGPFFKSLIDGGCIGEAFIFSTPYLNWTISLFGDPLAKVVFLPNKKVTENNLSELDYNVKSWNGSNIDVAKILAYYVGKTKILENTMNEIVLSDDMIFSLDNLYSFYDYYAKNKINNINRFSKIVNNLSEYATGGIIKKSNGTINTIVDLLNYSDSKVSRLYFGLNTGFSDLDSNYYYDEGYWELEFLLKDETNRFENYNFEVLIYKDSNYSELLFSLDSSLIRSGWEYEFDKDIFMPIEETGVSTSYYGMRIRYKCSAEQLVETGDILYCRIRQKTESETFPYVDLTEVAFG